ncbi:hypothetical protein ACQEVB_01805 [Pseudonocardia sp. CA-107938]|uniref:hypothetical protein n=1 Tax=Pseudonocardia sp. CA-107938 TaxID=3240021 RepID=UPI003D8FDEFA
MRRFPAALSGTASGIGFGLLTWSIAHVATLIGFAHIHPGFVVHYHGWAGPLAIAVLMLAVTSLVAVGSALRHPPARVAGWQSVVQGALAPAVFVGVEFAEFLAGMHEAPPAALLVIGSLVHAAIGAASPVLWAVFVERARRQAVTPFRTIRPVRRLVVRAAQRTWTSAWEQGPWSSRAPPAGRVCLAA